MAKDVVVYPIEGHLLIGVPAAPVRTTPAIAERLVRTGAFGREGSGEAVPLSEAAVAALDFYDNLPDQPLSEAVPAPEATE
jgi:hypothetical protein